MKSTRGEALTLILIAIVVLGGGAYGVSKTKWFHKDTKRAKTSTETTAALVDATQKQGAVAAASVVKIGEANSTAPASPSKEFISREVPVALASLPAPDVLALIEAEKRKVAVMEGRLAEASALYGDAMKRADEYQRETARALAAKRASDLALEQAAAETRGAEQQAFWFMCAMIGAGVLYVYTKLTHLSPAALAATVADIRSPSPEVPTPMAAVNTHTSRIQQLMTRLNVKLFHSN